MTEAELVALVADRATRLYNRCRITFDGKRYSAEYRGLFMSFDPFTTRWHRFRQPVSAYAETRESAEGMGD